VKPDVPRRPSESHLVLPKVGGRLPSDNASDKPASATDNATAIYATPFGRPPVVVKKPPTAGTEAPSLQDYSEVPQNPKSPAVKSSTGVDAKAFREYSEICTFHSVPSLSSGSPVYSEVDVPPKNGNFDFGNSGDGNSKPQSPSYEYADPNAVGKWSLQHIARGKPVECEYATIPAEYCDGDPYSSVDLPSGQSNHVLSLFSFVLLFYLSAVFVQRVTSEIAGCCRPVRGLNNFGHVRPFRSFPPLREKRGKRSWEIRWCIGSRPPCPAQESWRCSTSRGNRESFPFRRTSR